MDSSKSSPMETVTIMGTKLFYGPTTLSESPTKLFYGSVNPYNSFVGLSDGFVDL